MNAEKIDEILLEKIMYALTLRSRGEEKQNLWIDKGFSRITPEKLKNYWKNKIKNDEDSLELFETIALEYEKHNYELLRNQEAHVLIDIEGIDEDDIPALLFKRFIDNEAKLKYDNFKKNLLHTFTMITGVSGENLEININIVSKDEKEKQDLLDFLKRYTKRTIRNSMVKKNTDLQPIKQPVEGEEKSSSPSMWSMVKSATSAVGKFAKGGFKSVTSEQFEERLAICKGCEFWNSSGFAGSGQCSKCGCSTQAKLRFPGEKCPIDKWLPTV